LLVNGTKLPVDGPHMSPTLDGTCSAAAATLVCQSGACDTGDNACGYANGDGPCDATNGAVVCRSGICASDGTNKNLCVACLQDSQCGGSTPLCDTTTNSCVQCTASPQCASDSPVCDTKKGLCTTGCAVDSDCMSTQWCNAPQAGTGLCEDKLPDGTPLPSIPATVATCSPEVGARVCVSGVCDSTTQSCGGTACTTDNDCTASDFCGTTGCTPKLPTGAVCDRARECQKNDCNQGVCSEVVAQGAGLCAVSEPGKPDGNSRHGAFALLLTLAGLGIARRRPARRHARRTERPS
jgi:hypothetical protein